MSHLSRPDLSVVLPAYGERKNVICFLPRIRTFLGELGVSYEVLGIDTVAYALSQLDN